jgi:uncharacterized protein (TIGR02246 family)
MRVRVTMLLMGVFLVCGTSNHFVSAQPPKDGNAADEAALLKQAEEFVEAFHKGDAKAIAAFWTADGDYTDQTGKVFKGREGIEKQFKGFFAENKDLKLRIDIAALKFVTPDVAIEDGTTSVIAPDGGPPSRARYTIVHVKKDGKWLLSSVRDAPYTAPSNHDQLSGLEWLIGDWAAETGKGEVIRIAFAWTDTENFVVSTFTTSFKNISIGGGTQWIGWDPLAKKVRAWTFETNGGFGEGLWTQDEGKWVSKFSGVIRDGTKMAGTNTLTRIDADTVTWQATDRTENGKALPDIKAVTLKRIK